MRRLRDALDACRRENRKAMGCFLTNGFPEPSATVPLLQALDEAGADFLELGMPFSDPLAEGGPIQRASARALAHGVRMADAFRTTEAFRATSETPVVLMGYVNPVLRYGAGDFCRDAVSAGVDGLILPDLPPDEADLLREPAQQHGLALTFLIAPNTPDARVRLVDRQSTGFVYAVSVTGLTGASLGDRDGTDAYLHRARGLVERNPLLVGFGIKTAEDARRLTRHTDGFIVGSAFVEAAEAAWADPSLTDSRRIGAVAGLARALRAGVAPLERVEPPAAT